MAGEGADKTCVHEIPGLYYYNGMALYDTTPRWIIDKVKNFRFRSNDVLIAAGPKCGTSYIQEIVYLVENGADVRAADALPSFMRVPYMELIASPEEARTQSANALNALAAMPHDKRRVMKSHFPVYFFEDQISTVGLKVILGLRNPKDVLTSFYHFYRMNKALGQFPGTWDQFFTMFQRKQLLYGDYLDWAVGWWKTAQKHDNVLVLKYEDLKQGPEREVRRVAEFLGHELSDDQIDTIVRATDFKEMASKPTTNYSMLQMFDLNISPFMRKGCVGDWRNHFSPEQNGVMDALIREKLEPAGLTFRYDS